MLKLNIISAELKKEIKNKELFISLKVFCAVILVLFCLYNIVFLVFQLVLHEHFIETIHETTLVTKGGENYGGRISQINQEIESIAKIQSEAKDWSYLFEFLGQITGNDIRLSRIAIDTKANSVTISGNSLTRDNLLAFKDKIEKTNFLENVDFPLKNLLEKTDIDFEISAKFKNYEFKSTE